MNKEKSSKGQNIRQIVLVGILIVVLAGFLYDRYVLFPDANDKINKVMNEVSMRLSPENRNQVHEILGRSPSNTFTHNGIEVEQYRFPRGLPFFPKPVLDVAYDGDTLAFFRQQPIDNAYIDSQRGSIKIDNTLAHDPGEPMLMGAGGNRRPVNNPDNEKDDESNDNDSEATGEDSSSDDEDSGSDGDDN